MREILISVMIDAFLSTLIIVLKIFGVITLEWIAVLCIVMVGLPMLTSLVITLPILYIIYKNTNEQLHFRSVQRK